MATHQALLAAWRAQQSDALADALDALDADLAPLPDLTDAAALAAWHEVARGHDPAQLGRLLEPLVAALELDPPQPPQDRKTWRTAMSEAVHALLPFLPDPRLSPALLLMLHHSSSDDWFHPDEAAHLVAPPRPVNAETRPRSLGAVLLEGLARAADPRLPDWIDRCTSRMTEVDCNGAEMRDALVALADTLHAAGAVSAGAAPARLGSSAMPSALRRRLDLDRSVSEAGAWVRLRVRGGALLQPGARLHRGPDLLAWSGWARVRALEVPSFFPPRYLTDGRLKALSGVFGLNDWDAAELLHAPRPLQTLAVRAPSLARDADDEPLPEPPEPAASDDDEPEVPIEAYAHDEPVEAEWLEAEGADAAFEAMAAGSDFEPEPATTRAEPEPFETLAEALLRGHTVPGLRTLRVSLHHGGRDGLPQPESFRWLWQTRLGQQLHTLGVVATDAAQVRAWWDEAARLPPTLRCVELFEHEPVVAEPEGFVIELRRDGAGPFTRVAVRGPSDDAARMAEKLPEAILMLPTLRTPRLILRPWRDSDREPWAALNADLAVMEHFPAPLTRAESDERLDRIRARGDADGFGLWAVEAPGAAPFIGFVGLSAPNWVAAFTPCIEVGWRLAAAHWGRGYAHEAAREALRFGFETLELNEIVSFTVPANTRSWRLMERLGMQRDPSRDFDHPSVLDGPLRRHWLYRLARPR